MAHCRTNKAQTLYGTDSFVCSIVVNSAGTGILSGHADGSIVRWYVAEDQNARNQVSGDQSQWLDNLLTLLTTVHSALQCTVLYCTVQGESEKRVELTRA